MHAGANEGIFWSIPHYLARLSEHANHAPHPWPGVPLARAGGGTPRGTRGSGRPPPGAGFRSFRPKWWIIADNEIKKLRGVSFQKKGWNGKRVLFHKKIHSNMKYGTERSFVGKLRQNKTWQWSCFFGKNKNYRNKKKKWGRSFTFHFCHVSTGRIFSWVAKKVGCVKKLMVKSLHHVHCHSPPQSP